MRHPRLVVFVLLFFVAGMASAAADELGRWDPADAQAHRVEGAHCPDPDDGGHPCGPACPCACCHGHAAKPLFVPQQLSLAPPQADTFDLNAYDGLHPKDVGVRIFHPPRS
jgi:hypothetical protein